MKPRIKSMISNIRKQKNNQNNKKKKRIQKKKKLGYCKQPPGKLQVIQHLHHREPEGKEKEEEIGNLFEKIMKENLLNMVREIDMQVQEAQRIPNKMDTKKPTPRHIIIKMPKVKDKEGFLKAAREKQLPPGEFP